LVVAAAGLLIVSKSCSTPSNATGSGEDAEKPAVNQTSLVKTPLFKQSESNCKAPANLTVEGDATWTKIGRRDEFSDRITADAPPAIAGRTIVAPTGENLILREADGPIRQSADD
jgi:hypothetical protein